MRRPNTLRPRKDSLLDRVEEQLELSRLKALFTISFQIA